MARYQMEDGTIVDTKNAAGSWSEDTQWNGNNHISVNTGSQWIHETLHKSAKGRYYIVHTSQWQGSTPSAEYITEEQAARWLIANGEDLPADLEAHAAAIEE